ARATFLFVGFRGMKIKRSVENTLEASFSHASGNPRSWYPGQFQESPRPSWSFDKSMSFRLTHQFLEMLRKKLLLSLKRAGRDAILLLILVKGNTARAAVPCAGHIQSPRLLSAFRFAHRARLLESLAAVRTSRMRFRLHIGLAVDVCVARAID